MTEREYLRTAGERLGREPLSVRELAMMADSADEYRVLRPIFAARQARGERWVLPRRPRRLHLIEGGRPGGRRLPNLAEAAWTGHLVRGGAR